MADFDYKTTLVKDDLIDQFKGKPRIEALMTVIAKQLQDVYDFYLQLKEDRGPYTATGIQLDRVGNIVDLTRAQAGLLAGDPIPFDILSDDLYRQFVIFKILKNTSACTYPTIIKAFKLFWDYPLYYTEDPDQPATMIFDTGDDLPGTVDTTPLFTTPLIRAAGVTLKLYARTTTTLDTAYATIYSGLGYAATTNYLPELERDIDYGTQLTLRTGFLTATKDTLPEMERNIDYGTRVRVHAGHITDTKDTLPSVERDYRLNQSLKLAYGPTQVDTKSSMPTASIMETPISGLMYQ